VAETHDTRKAKVNPAKESELKILRTEELIGHASVQRSPQSLGTPEALRQREGLRPETDKAVLWFLHSPIAAEHLLAHTADQVNT
jgi:hypothetical protein